MADKTRTYRMQRRAESQAQTRLRITESAVALHGTVGPSRTSISAVAAHAGVRRSTVYRHFPDEAALFDACSAHWAAANPPPDLTAWSAIENPDARLRVALGELYAFYRQTEAMLDNLFRDEDTVPLVRERFAVFRSYVAAARDALMVGRSGRGKARRRERAALGHAISFSTWKSLAREQGLTDADAVSLLCALVAAAS
ncbi:MAG TPA: helix-turn-helix domain-containing protein [Gaiellaceae bacterium]|nr:helix-turn-helix domain-containing protein [Gaiellaceae bacterium]